MDLIRNWQGFHLDPPGSVGWLFVLLAIGAVAYAVWIYRRTDAPLNPSMRWLLTGLRASLLLLTIFILCRPVVSVALPGGAERGVLVLLDRSLSLMLPGAGDSRTRAEEADLALSQIMDRAGSAYPLTVRPFAGSLDPALDPEAPLPPADQEGTAIASALERGVTEGVEAGRPGAVILVTDGTQTVGGDPVPVARRLGLPVSVVPLGSDRPVDDLSLVRVKANRDAFLGERTPVEAVLRLHGLPSTEVRVGLYDTTDSVEVALAEETVRVDPGGAERRVPLVFQPDKVGLRFIEVRVSGIPGEATSANNRRLVAVEVREDKAGLLFLSGALTWDHTFIRRALEADSTLLVSSGIWKGNRFVSTRRGRAMPAITEDGLRGVRVVVLDHVTPGQLGSGAGILASFVRAGGGLILVAGSDGDALSRWEGTPLAELLPVRIGSGGTAREEELRLASGARRHVLFDPSVPGAPSLEAWNALPPLTVAPGLGALRGNAEELMAPAGVPPGSRSVLSWVPAGSGRVLLLAGGGVWRWDFTGPASRSVANVLPPWWRRAAQWMARPEVETRFDVHPDEMVTPRGAPVRFVSRVLDQAYRPLPDVDVEIEVRPAGDPGAAARTLELTGSEGFLSGAMTGLEPGRYVYRGRASNPREDLGQVEGVFAVDSLGTELDRLESDHELLARLAEATGGRLWHPDSLDNLARDLELVAHAEEEQVQVPLWDQPLAFALFILLGSAEWILRRRRGLI